MENLEDKKQQIIKKWNKFMVIDDAGAKNNFYDCLALTDDELKNQLIYIYNEHEDDCICAFYYILMREELLNDGKLFSNERKKFLLKCLNILEIPLSKEIKKAINFAQNLK